MMEKTKHNTANTVIDWELGTQLANNNRALAEELLELLLKQLPHEFSLIQQAYKNDNIPLTLQYLHKLHGAVCYCGVPRLKKAISALEKAYKEHADTAEVFAIFEEEVKKLLPYTTK